MKNEKIKLYAATGLLTAALLTGAGFKIHDTYIDHTKEVCPITRIMNTFSGTDYTIPTAGILHQWREMKNDYRDNGIKNVNISYGQIIKEKSKTDIVMPTVIESEDGETRYFSPSGYTLTTTSTGERICVRTTTTITNMGYGFTATWDEPKNNHIEKKEETLVIRK